MALPFVPPKIGTCRASSATLTSPASRPCWCQKPSLWLIAARRARRFPVPASCRAGVLPEAVNSASCLVFCGAAPRVPHSAVAGKRDGRAGALLCAGLSAGPWSFPPFARLRLAAAVALRAPLRRSPPLRGGEDPLKALQPTRFFCSAKKSRRLPGSVRPRFSRFARKPGPHSGARSLRSLTPFRGSSPPTSSSSRGGRKRPPKPTGRARARRYFRASVLGQTRAKIARVWPAPSPENSSLAPPGGGGRAAAGNSR